MNYKAEALLKGKTIISKEPGNSMTPRIKSRQPVKLAPASECDVKVGDIVFCKVRGKFYTHLVKAKDKEKGCLIGNNHGHNNGWTHQIFGKVIDMMRH